MNINELTETDKLKVLRGLADVEAGRVRLAEDFFAEVEERRSSAKLPGFYDCTGRK